jgi:hypothetical protein
VNFGSLGAVDGRTVEVFALTVLPQRDQDAKQKLLSDHYLQLISFRVAQKTYTMIDTCNPEIASW